MNYLYAFGVAFIFIFYFKNFLNSKSLSSPTVVYTLYWLVFLFFFFCFDDNMLNYSGVVWIFGSILIFNLSNIFVSNVSLYNKSFISIYYKKDYMIYYRKNDSNEKMKKITIVLSIILTLLSVREYILSGGIKNVSKVAYDYYTSTDNNSSLINTIVIQIHSFLIYINGYLCGYIFKNIKYKVISFLCFIPPVISMFTTSGKLGVIVVTMCFTIGYLIASIEYKRKITNKTFIKFLKRYWILIPIIVLGFTLSLTLRFGIVNEYYLNIAFNKFKSYAFGSVAAFTNWFENAEIEYSMGLRTFTGIPQALGFASRKAGVYNEVVTTGVWSTNVYTAFRGVIEDFGKVGGMGFIFLFGMVSNYAHKSYSNKGGTLSFIILTNSYLFILYSFIISPFVYFNLSIIFILYSFLKFFLKKIKFIL